MVLREKWKLPFDIFSLKLPHLQILSIADFKFGSKSFASFRENFRTSFLSVFCEYKIIRFDLRPNIDYESWVRKLYPVFWPDDI